MLNITGIEVSFFENKLANLYSVLESSNNVQPLNPPTSTAHIAMEYGTFWHFLFLLKTSIRFFVSGFRLQASGFRLQVSGFRLQAADCRFQASAVKLPTMSEYFVFSNSLQIANLHDR